MRCEFACAARGCDGCTLCQPEKWLKHYQTENARLREALSKIFWILNKGTAKIWPDKALRAASDIAREALEGCKDL